MRCSNIFKICYLSLFIFLALTVSKLRVFASPTSSTFNQAPKIESHMPPEVPGIDSNLTFVSSTMRWQEKLMHIAFRYIKLHYVPYVWGGGVVGEKEECLSCRECVIAQKIPLKSRLAACPSCQQCGLDCSHFINKVYSEAGLEYDYASTGELTRQTKEGLFKNYHFIDIGKDLINAQPGDLLVFKQHITMLSRVINNTHGDFLHITRFRRGDNTRLGGFSWERNRNIARYRGGLIRILRHKRFFEDDDNLFFYAVPIRKLYQQLYASLRNS